MTRTVAAAAPGLPVSPHHPDWDHAGQHDSRTLAAIVAASAQPMEEHPDAELTDLGERWLALRKQWAMFGNPVLVISDEDANRITDDLGAREGWLTEAITALPARTAAGLAVKARILAVAHDCDHHDDDAIAVWAGALPRDGVHLDMAIGSLVRDLLRLAAEMTR